MTEWVHNFMEIALCSKYGKISHVTWKIPFPVKHCSLNSCVVENVAVSVLQWMFTIGANLALIFVTFCVILCCVSLKRYEKCKKAWRVAVILAGMRGGPPFIKLVWRTLPNCS
jgi:hypothetical protein